MVKTIACWLLICVAWCCDGVGQVPGDSCLELAEIPAELFVSSHCAYLNPRRIVVVTTLNREDRLKEQDLFAGSLAKHLRHGQRFDVVISRDKICRNKLPMRVGKFDEQELLTLAGAYNVDAVLYCEIDEICAYEPMQVQMSILLIDIGEAVALVSASSTLDLRNPVVLQGYTTFAGQTCDHFTTDTHMNSPTLFIDYAAGLLANRVARSFPGCQFLRQPSLGE